MDAIEMVSYVKDISNNILELFEKKERDAINNKVEEIKEKLELMEKIEELSSFVNNTRRLISIFEDYPVDENKRSESFLRLISMISSEKSRIIEKYSFCSEPE